MGTSRSDGARKTATADPIERAAAVLSENLQVEQVNFSYVLGVTVGSQNPEMSQRLAATIADDYLDGQQKARVGQMQQVVDWLRSQLDELQSRVATTEAAIGKLKAEGGFTDAGPNSNVSEQRISDLNSQLQATRAEVVKTRAAFDQARRVLESHGEVTDIPEVMASPFIGQLRQQRSGLSPTAGGSSCHARRARRSRHPHDAGEPRRGDQHRGGPYRQQYEERLRSRAPGVNNLFRQAYNPSPMRSAIRRITST